jgi:hypothetical protein
VDPDGSNLVCTELFRYPLKLVKFLQIILAAPGTHSQRASLRSGDRTARGDPCIDWLMKVKLLRVSYLVVDCQLTTSLIAVVHSGRTFTLFVFKRVKENT